MTKVRRVSNGHGLLSGEGKGSLEYVPLREQSPEGGTERGSEWAPFPLTSEVNWLMIKCWSVCVQVWMAVSMYAWERAACSDVRF